jgi:hypothetical protein
VKKYHQGWYPLTNPEKYIKPADGYMKSTKLYDGKIFIQYKSSLEKNAIKYADLNPKVLKWSQEPFCIQYIKPIDNKEHRYFVDMYIEFVNGYKVIVEIKPYDQTIPPKKPKKMTSKQIINYKDSVMTYIVNKAKWNSASNFAKSKGLKFVILTEKQLNPSKT